MSKNKDSYKTISDEKNLWLNINHVRIRSRSDQGKSDDKLVEKDTT